MVDAPSFLYEMGLVLRGTPAAGARVACSSHQDPAILAATAARLAAFAVTMEWVHVVRLLLPLTLTSGRSPAEVVANMDACLPEGGCTRGAADRTLHSPRSQS